MAVKAYTQPGDSVLIQLPVYYPFSEVIQDNGRKVVSSNLYQGEDNRYHIDFQDFEKKIVEENVKLFFLCNPHNPVGRVWSAEELEKIGDICVKNGVTVVSDEIHQDFVFKGKHQVFASLKKEFQDISITCTSPSKTFNLASMMISNIFISQSGASPKITGSSWMRQEPASSGFWDWWQQRLLIPKVKSGTRQCMLMWRRISITQKSMWKNICLG